jgi:hypothetical protein
MKESLSYPITGRLDSVDTYNPASYRGGILRLHYARAPELGPWLDLVAVRGEVVVQFWLRPGEAAVTLGSGEEQREERIPEQIKKFLYPSVEEAKKNCLSNYLYFYCSNISFNKRPLITYKLGAIYIELAIELGKST